MKPTNDSANHGFDEASAAWSCAARRLAGLVALLALGLAACGADSDGGRAPQDTGRISPEQGVADLEQEALSVELAHIYLDSGREARFTRFPDTGDVLYEERGPTGSRPAFARDPDLDVLDMFLSLVPETTAVPRALLTAASDSSLARVGTRELVDAIAQPIVNQAAFPGSHTLGESHSSDDWDCSQNASDFEDFACSNADDAIDFCDSGQSSYVQRTAGASRKKSLGVFVACGTDVMIRHYYADCCNWHNRFESVLPSGHWMWSRYTGAAKWNRRIRYDRVSQPAGSYLRAYSAFYN